MITTMFGGSMPLLAILLMTALGSIGDAWSSLRAQPCDKRASATANATTFIDLETPLLQSARLTSLHRRAENTMPDTISGARRVRFDRR
jgi:hypothetical protein